MFWNPPIGSRAFLLEAAIDFTSTPRGGVIISESESKENKRELEEMKRNGIYN